MNDQNFISEGKNEKTPRIVGTEFSKNNDITWKANGNYFSNLYVQAKNGG